VVKKKLAVVVLGLMVVWACGCEEPENVAHRRKLTSAISAAQRRLDQAHKLMAAPAFTDAASTQVSPLGEADGGKLEADYRAFVNLPEADPDRETFVQRIQVLGPLEPNPRAMTILNLAKDELSGAIGSSASAEKSLVSLARQTLADIIVAQADCHATLAARDRAEALAGIAQARGLAARAGATADVVAVYDRLLAPGTAEGGDHKDLRDLRKKIETEAQDKYLRDLRKRIETGEENKLPRAGESVDEIKQSPKEETMAIELALEKLATDKQRLEKICTEADARYQAALVEARATPGAKGVELLSPATAARNEAHRASRDLAQVLYDIEIAKNRLEILDAWADLVKARTGSVDESRAARGARSAEHRQQRDKARKALDGDGPDDPGLIARVEKLLPLVVEKMRKAKANEDLASNELDAAGRQITQAAVAHPAPARLDLISKQGDIAMQLAKLAWQRHHLGSPASTARCPPRSSRPRSTWPIRRWPSPTPRAGSPRLPSTTRTPPAGPGDRTGTGRSSGAISRASPPRRPASTASPATPRPRRTPKPFGLLLLKAGKTPDSSPRTTSGFEPCCGTDRVVPPRMNDRTACFVIRHE